jgi:hypothetical protein
MQEQQREQSTLLWRPEVDLLVPPPCTNRTKNSKTHHATAPFFLMPAPFRPGRRGRRAERPGDPCIQVRR